MRLVLASASPRRRELLDNAGFDFDVHAVDVDERRLTDEGPAAYVERVARLKAAAGAKLFGDRPVLGADTVVVVDGDVLGKPRDATDAAEMLRRLSGRTHEVYSGVAIAMGARCVATVERTSVRVDPLSEDDVRAYVASGEPFDKAGAYAIQGRASRFVAGIEGSYSNVVGLPITAVVRLLKAAGLIPGGTSG